MKLKSLKMTAEKFGWAVDDSSPDRCTFTFGQRRIYVRVYYDGSIAGVRCCRQSPRGSWYEGYRPKRRDWTLRKFADYLTGEIDGLYFWRDTPSLRYCIVIFHLNNRPAEIYPYGQVYINMLDNVTQNWLERKKTIFEGQNEADLDMMRRAATGAIPEKVFFDWIEERYNFQFGDNHELPHQELDGPC